MSKTHWVCKHDGTIQCDDSIPEISLGKMRKELASLIGEKEILNMAKKSIGMITLCGIPTGNLNAYEITELGWQILSTGLVGKNGFELCLNSDNDEDTTRDLLRKLTTSQPCTIRELIGHPIRAFEEGSDITMDWRPNRVNFVTKNGEIIDIYFG